MSHNALLWRLSWRDWFTFRTYNRIRYFHITTQNDNNYAETDLLHPSLSSKFYVNLQDILNVLSEVSNLVPYKAKLFLHIFNIHVYITISCFPN